MKIPQIELGNVVPGAVVLTADKGINETYIGYVDVGSIRHKAYIKVLNSKQLVNELVATTLGRALGLPIPRGFLLNVRPEDLPDSELLKNFNQDALVYGSHALNHPALARRFNVNGIEAIKWLKTNFTILDETIIFDDLIANIDRHLGNLLIGSSGEVWLIDHGHCLTGPNWETAHLVANRQFQNILANTFIPELTLPERMGLKCKASRLSVLVDAIDKESAIGSCFVNQLLSAEEVGALLGFLNERVKHIVNIISDRVGVPMLEGKLH